MNKVHIWVGLEEKKSCACTAWYHNETEVIPHAETWLLFNWLNHFITVQRQKMNVLLSLRNKINKAATEDMLNRNGGTVPFIEFRGPRGSFIFKHIQLQKHFHLLDIKENFLLFFSQGMLSIGMSRDQHVKSVQPQDPISCFGIWQYYCGNSTMGHTRLQ